MPRKTLEKFSASLIRYRRWVTIVLIALGAGAGAFAFELETQFHPSMLVGDSGIAVDEEPAPLVFLLHGINPDDSESLRASHRVATALQQVDWVDRVDSATTSALPYFRPPAELTLLEIEADPTLLEADPLVLDALTRVVAALPERFPGGTERLAERGELVVEPLASSAPTLDDADISRLRAAQRHGLLDRFLGENSIAIFVTPKDAPQADSARQLQEATLELGAVAGNAELLLSGVPYLESALSQRLEEDHVRTILLAFVGSVFVLLLGFRSAGAVAIPMAAVGITLAVVFGAMAFFGRPLTLMTNVLPPLLVAIGLGDGVHLLSRYQQLRVSLPAVAAAKETARTMAVACFFTSFTTAIGFLSLAFGRSAVVAEFGVLAAVSVMVVFVVTILFVGASLPSLQLKPKEPAQLRFLWGWTRHCIARPVPTAVFSFVLTLGCLFLWPFVPKDGALIEQFSADDPVVAGARVLEEEFRGINPVQVDFEALGSPEEQLAVLGELESFGEANSLLLDFESARDSVRAALAVLLDAQVDPELAFSDPLLTAALWDLVGATSETEVRSLGTLSFYLRDSGAGATQGFTHSLERKVVSLGAAPHFSGAGYRASRGLERVAVDLIRSLGFATLVIFVVLAVLFRSARLGLVSLVPNVLPLAVTLAYMAARGIPLNVGTMMVFAVSLGLAVDGTIHVLARFRELQGHPLAIERTMASSTSALVIAAFTLLLGFFALMFSAFLPIQRFAELSAVAISTSLASELLVLPAWLALLTRGKVSRVNPNRAVPVIHRVASDDRR